MCSLTRCINNTAHGTLRQPPCLSSSQIETFRPVQYSLLIVLIAINNRLRCESEWEWNMAIKFTITRPAWPSSFWVSQNRAKHLSQAMEWARSGRLQRQRKCKLKTKQKRREFAGWIRARDGMSISCTSALNYQLVQETMACLIDWWWQKAIQCAGTTAATTATAAVATATQCQQPLDIYIYIFEDDILFEILISGCKPISRRWKTYEMAEKWAWESSLPTQSAMDNGPAIQKIWYTYTEQNRTQHHLLMHYVSGWSIGRLVARSLYSIYSTHLNIHFLCIFPFVYLHTQTHAHTRAREYILIELHKVNACNFWIRSYEFSMLVFLRACVCVILLSFVVITLFLA